MERLTKRDEFGNADIIGVDSQDLQLNLEFEELNRVTDALNRLASYEDTGLTPEKILNLDKEFTKQAKELMECRKKMDGWIPCSERLPDEEEMKKAYCRNHYGSEFIVQIKGANRPTTLYRTINGFWKDDNSEIYDNVIAWQTLPKPYKEGKE